MAEFELIQRIAQRVRPRADVRLGIGDDAALLVVPPGYLLAVSCDTLNESVHFAAGDDPRAIGHKSAAVNLSDLAAMGAEPTWFLLGLSLPAAEPDWLDAFIDGFVGQLEQHGATLVGGDTTRGPRSIQVTAQGLVPPGDALRRDGGRIGDDLWVTGTLGDAAAGLAGLGEGAAHTYLRGRLLRPQPRVAAGIALRRRARACIDVSDGLLADLGHILRASGAGAEVHLADLPTSQPLREAVPDSVARGSLQLGGGDDYELLFSANPIDRRLIERVVEETGTPVTRIGRLVETPGCVVLDAAGQPFIPPRSGYQHFAGDSA